jgi:hypothetical protein
MALAQILRPVARDETLAAKRADYQAWLQFPITKELLAHVQAAYDTAIGNALALSLQPDKLAAMQVELQSAANLKATLTFLKGS